MIESLEKKIEALDKIIGLDKKQLSIALAEPFDVEAYDASMDEKDGLIDALNKLDDGFMNTYELVRGDLQSNPKAYAEKVQRMQNLIRLATEKTVAIRTQEQRGKQAMQSAVSRKRNEIRSVRVSNAAAAKYYKSMSRINDVDPQLMDKKK